MTKYQPIFWDIETTGTNPLAQEWYSGEMAARVTSVAIGKAHGWREADSFEEAEYDVKAYWDEEEYRLLKVVRQRLKERINDIVMDDSNNEPVLVGWNSRNFDHPYMGARYARLRLNGSDFNNTLKRLDMMRALGNDEVMEKMYPGQDDYAKELGIEVNEELTGKDMPKAYRAEDWGKIQQHAEDDVREMMKTFVEKKGDCYEELYWHYDDIKGQPPKFNEKVEF